MKLISESNILYVRASLRPIAAQIKSYGDIYNYLQSKVEFSDIFAPHFFGSRPFWRNRINPIDKRTNSGALGKAIRRIEGSALSSHPTHAFTGFGPQILPILASHTQDSKCFEPILKLVDANDFSMLLLGCIDESPGFSTVHAAQERLGLTQRHLERFLLRWDYIEDGITKSKIAPESPGCSRSFWKFYEYYKADNNLITGNWNGAEWIYIQSARRAMSVELNILSETPRFVNCRNIRCTTCNFRLY